MIALACFLSFIQFLISSLIQILRLAWKTAIVVLASVITVMKKEEILPNSALRTARCGSKCFLKGPNVHFFKAEFSLRIIPAALPRASTGTGHGHQKAECFAAGGSGLPCMTWASAGSTAWLLLPAVLVSS